MSAEPGASLGTRPYLASGPVVWLATIACTTLLLTLLKQALWLVVPFLFAIILYYALFPTVRRLTLAGIDRVTAAGMEGF
jgi:predicted PurR-regulated permease PerM